MTLLAVVRQEPVQKSHPQARRLPQHEDCEQRAYKMNLLGAVLV